MVDQLEEQQMNCKDHGAKGGRVGKSLTKNSHVNDIMLSKQLDILGKANSSKQ